MLNGDGDSDDVVLHVSDSDASVTVNLGVDVPSNSLFSISPDVEVVLVNIVEPHPGLDLSSDGDFLDIVLYVVLLDRSDRQ